MTILLMTASAAETRPRGNRGTRPRGCENTNEIPPSFNAKEKDGRFTPNACRPGPLLTWRFEGKSLRDSPVKRTVHGNGFLRCCSLRPALLLNWCAGRDVS
jgi:hypothetical protein